MRYMLIILTLCVAFSNSFPQELVVQEKVQDHFVVTKNARAAETSPTLSDPAIEIARKKLQDLKKDKGTYEQVWQAAEELNTLLREKRLDPTVKISTGWRKSDADGDAGDEFRMNNCDDTTPDIENKSDDAEDTGGVLRWVDDDLVIANSNYNEAAVSIDIASNGDIYAAYEVYDPDIGNKKIQIRKSVDNGQSWTDWFYWYNSDEDCLFPTVCIGEGNVNRLMISYYSGSSQVLRLKSHDLSNASSYSSWYSFPTPGEIGADENVRPRIAIDTDNTWWVYIAWVEEDLAIDNVCYSRLEDLVNGTPTDPIQIGSNDESSVTGNLDIAWGNYNLYIVYQSGGWPGAIKVARANSNYGNPGDGFTITTETPSTYIYPRIAVSAHNDYACIISARQNDTGTFDLAYSRTYDGGDDWNTFYFSDWHDTRLGDIYYMPDNTTGRNFHAAWYQNGYIKYMSSDDLDNWYDITTISENNNNSDGDFVSVCATSENDGMAAWVYTFSASDLDVHFDIDLETTPLPEPPINPTPSNGANNQSINVNISWSDGGGAASYDVYFGTDSSPDAGEFRGNQGGTSYDPGNLQYNTTYYWRIDAVNTTGTTTGSVWHFNTGELPSGPTIFDESFSSVADWTPVIDQGTGSLIAGTYGGENVGILYMSGSPGVFNAYRQITIEIPAGSALTARWYYESSGIYNNSENSDGGRIRFTNNIPSESPSEGDIILTVMQSADFPMYQWNEEEFIIGENIPAGSYIAIGGAVWPSYIYNNWDFITIVAPTGLINEDSNVFPMEITLTQNYPNPFNPSTTIQYGLPEASKVQMTVYDVTGCQIRTLVNNTQQAGWYNVLWNGTDVNGQPVGTGTYLARIQAGDYSKTIKMVYLR